jgi:hypothetical protein
LTAYFTFSLERTSDTSIYRIEESSNKNKFDRQFIAPLKRKTERVQSGAKCKRSNNAGNKGSEINKITLLNLLLISLLDICILACV